MLYQNIILNVVILILPTLKKNPLNCFILSSREYNSYYAVAAFLILTKRAKRDISKRRVICSTFSICFLNRLVSHSWTLFRKGPPKLAKHMHWIDSTEMSIACVKDTTSLWHLSLWCAGSQSMWARQEPGV